MKAITLFVLSFLLFTCAITAQQRTDTAKNVFAQPDYRKISRTQKNAATALVISGGAIAVVGGYLWFMAPIAGLSESGNVEGAERTGKTLTLVGAGLAAISVPLFIASSENKKKAVLYTGFNSLTHPVKGTTPMWCVGIRRTLH